MTRMHKVIEQLDGGDPASDGIDENDNYKKTAHYWEKGKRKCWQLGRKNLERTLNLSRLGV